MARKRKQILVEITQKDLDRFHANAAAALARRGREFAMEEMSSGAQTIFLGTIPILGLIYWHWSGIEMLLFLIAGIWVGILCDSVKFFSLRERAEAFANARYDDWHVWVVVDALRSGTNKAAPAHLDARWEPVAGVVIDYFLGGVSTVFVIGTLIGEGVLEPRSVLNPYLWIPIAVMAALRFASTVWEIVSHKADSTNRRKIVQDRPVKVMVGLRGVGLFLLVFLVAVFADNKRLNLDAPKIMMLVVNGCVVLLGLMNLMGPLFLWRETKWLRDYLADQEKSKQRRASDR